MLLCVLGSLFLTACVDVTGKTACTCSAGDPCGPVITCKDDVDCEVVCTGTECTGKVVQCPEWGDCAVVCNRCDTMEIRCPVNTYNKCVLECTDCVDTTVVPSNKGQVYCTYCDAATLAAAFGSPTGASCRALPAASGPNASQAFPSCGLPAAHGSVCQSDPSVCDAETFTCINGSWPSTQIQCGVLPYDCGEDTTIYRIIQANMTCGSFDVPLVSTPLIDECAQQCSQTPGCKYFTFSTTECTWQQTQSDACVEGFTASNSSFYATIPAVIPCNGHGDCTTQGCICYSSAVTGFWAAKYCDICASGYATAECNVPCSGGACHKCSGHGWCAEGISGDGSCTCSDGWALPSCSACSTNRYGTDCRGVCPAGTGVVCSDHGECDSDRAGNGLCKCNDGWAPPLCDSCDSQHWGDDCSGECPGGGTCSGHGACNTNNGTCSCDPAWGGTACELPCNCNGNGVCVALDPPCACEIGWALPDCSTCEDGYGGIDCSRRCRGSPFCGGHGTCNAMASCTCNSGWYDDSAAPCSLSCPLGLRDAVCSGHGSCGGPASNFTCTCNSNWDGDDCSQCAAGLSGLYCSKACPVANGDVCNNRGECLDGKCYCNSGCGAACENDICPTRCPYPGVYNANCTGECPGYSSIICAGHGLCNDGRTGDGSCRCEPRGDWGGPECSKKCPSTNLLPCSGNGLCETTNATCTCDSGYVGADCSGVCPKTTRGICSGRGVCNSSAVCVCEAAWGGDSCNLFCGCIEGRGSCDDSGDCVCFPGFRGVTCRECESGWHGDNCTEPCAHGVAVAQQCKCIAMWSGPDCDHACPGLVTGSACNGKGTCLWGSDRLKSTCVCLPDWFGEDCSRQCTHDICALQFPFGSAVCDDQTGACICDDRHQGPQCSACSDQVWGSDCDQPCRCDERGSCDRVTGECTCYNEPGKGYFSGDLCQYCAEGWTGLPSCTTRNIPMTLHNTSESTVVQSSLSTLLFEDSVNKLAWVGGDPPVLFDLASQVFGGSVTLDACPVVKGWEHNGKVFLLSDICQLYSQPRLLRVSAPPTDASDWDGRSGTPLCTALSTEVCFVHEMTDSSRVVDATWHEDGPLVVVSASSMVSVVWVDTWGVSQGALTFRSNITIPTAVANVGGRLYYVCGLIAAAPGWACEGFTANASQQVSLTGRLQWISGAPSVVALASAVGSKNTLFISLGFTPPGGTAVGEVKHTCTNAVCSIYETTLVDTSRGGTPSQLAYDPMTEAVYSTTCGSRTCSLSRIAADKVFSSTELVITGVGALAVDVTRRLLYVLPQTPLTSLKVLSAFCALLAVPSTFYSSGGTSVTLPGFGYKIVADSETGTSCYFGGVSVPGTVISKHELACTTPPVTSLGCNKDTIDVSLFDPVGAVPPYISSCDVHFTPQASPYLMDAVPFLSSLAAPVEVAIRGRGFLPSPDLKCRFDPAKHVVTARYINNTHIGCMPPPMTPSSGTSLTMTLDGQGYVMPGVSVQFVGDAAGLEAVIMENVVKSKVPALTVPTIEVYSVDVAGNRLLEYDNTTRVLSASLLWYYTDIADDDRNLQSRPKYKAFTGELTTTMVNGRGVFDGLVIEEARAANASIAIASVGLEGALATLLITAGDPYAFIFLTQPYPMIERGTGRLVPGVGGAVSRSDEPVVGVVDVLGSLLMSYNGTIAAQYATLNSVGEALIDRETVALTIPKTSYDLTAALNGVRYTFNVSSPSRLLQYALSDEMLVMDCPYGSKMNNQSGCDGCPVGGVCNGTNIVVSKNGYWQSENSSVYYKCGQGGCEEGSRCKEGSMGPICGSCEDGWVDDGTGCVKCIPITAVVLAFLLLLLVMFVVHVGWVVFLSTPLSTGGSTQINPLHGILFSSGLYLQCDGLLGYLPLHTGWLRNMYLWEYRISTGDITDVPISSCLIRRTQSPGEELHVGVVYYMLLPVWAVILAAAARLAVWYRYNNQAAPPKSLGEQGDARFSSIADVPFKKLLPITGFMVWFVQVHPMLMGCFNLLACTDFILQDDPFYKVSRLKSDTMMQCGGNYRDLAIAGLVLYVGVGTVAGVLCCKKYLESGGTVVTSFITGGFKAGYWWWWVVLLVRRLVIQLIIVFGSGVRGQLVMINLASLTLLFATAFYKPWVSSVNQHECLLLLFSVVSSQLALQYDTSSHWVLSVLICVFKLGALTVIGRKVYLVVREHYPFTAPRRSRENPFRNTSLKRKSITFLPERAGHEAAMPSDSMLKCRMTINATRPSCADPVLGADTELKVLGENDDKKKKCRFVERRVSL
eukprot:TRINITY_DN22744_c0_g1_i1.p1 TRINITY_DN22744_c0_g1~~TRINITY_DN22744_c0_g1_i1.p1  ORF type:complete len:2269 (+),score=250.38 TRINITY_DN22744_c0_g1_i1:43-6849(+)